MAVDAVGSFVFGGEPAKRLIPGHGAARRPELFQPGLADRCILVTDLDCIVGCRRLVRREAIMAGGSSGAVIMAIEQVNPELPRGSISVALLPDRGERYLDTIYSDDWVERHFGRCVDFWQEPLLAGLCGGGAGLRDPQCGPVPHTLGAGPIFKPQTNLRRRRPSKHQAVLCNSERRCYGDKDEDIAILL